LEKSDSIYLSLEGKKQTIGIEGLGRIPFPEGKKHVPSDGQMLSLLGVAHRRCGKESAVFFLKTNASYLLFYKFKSCTLKYSPFFVPFTQRVRLHSRLADDYVSYKDYNSDGNRILLTLL
jgi:hypothetical protein